MREKPHHPSYVRLLEAGAKKGFADANAVAKALGEGEQTVSNWGRRGVSKNGAQKAQKYLECDSNWILEGEAAGVTAEAGGHQGGRSRTRAPAGLSALALNLAELFDELPPDRRLRVLLHHEIEAILLKHVYPHDAAPIALPAPVAPDEKQPA